MLKKSPSLRPKIKIERTSLDTLLEALGIWALILMVFITVQYWSKLPTIIPTHFNAAGQVDGWGGKETLFLLPIMGTLMYLMMALLSKYPHIYNYVWKITEANAAVQYRLAVTLVNYLRTYIALLFAYLQYATIENALGRAQGLGAWFLPFTLLASFGPLIIYFGASFRAR